MRRLLVSFAIVAGVAAPAAAQERAPAPNRVIYPGETISYEALGDVALKRGAVLEPDIATSPEELVGKIAKRTLLPNRVISTKALRQAYLVNNGSPAEVRFVAGGLTIAITALPLQDGGVGDIVRVRNMETGVTFSGMVLADGTIRVGAT